MMTINSLQFTVNRYFKKGTKVHVQPGFTMVEHLIYMGIFSLLLVVLLQVFTSILDVHLEAQATSVITQDGNFILSRIAYDVRNAKRIESPVLGSSSTTSMRITGSSTDYTYLLSSGNLLLTNNTTHTSDPLNGDNVTVSSVSFTHLGNNLSGDQNTIRITIVLESKIIRSGGKIQTETFSTTVGTRKQI